MTHLSDTAHAASIHQHESDNTAPRTGHASSAHPGTPHATRPSGDGPPGESAAPNGPRILVVIDDAEAARRSIACAEHLARAIGGSVLLGHVRYAREAGTPVADVDDRYRVVFVQAAPRESIAEAIERVAQESQAALIVMASHSVGSAREAITGGTVTSLLGHSDRPVLLVGPEVRPPADRLPYHLVLAVAATRADSVALSDIAAILQSVRAPQLTVTLLHVYRPGFGDPALPTAIHEWQGAMRGLQEQIQLPVPIRTSVWPDQRLRAPVDQGLRDASEELDADAIWMASQGYSIRHRVLLGSVALATARHSSVPVIVSPATSRRVG